MHYTPAREIQFTVTREEIANAHNRQRGMSQKQLTGVACREVFLASDIVNPDKSEGKYYHWSHLIGHCLGGAQDPENLAPGTAASNYNTLEIIENHIRTLFQTHPAETLSHIDMTVTPFFSSRSKYIPEQFRFILSYYSAQKAQLCTETIHIDTQTHHRITLREHVVLQQLRPIERVLFSDSGIDANTPDEPTDEDTEPFTGPAL